MGKHCQALGKLSLQSKSNVFLLTTFHQRLLGFVPACAGGAFLQAYSP